MPDADAAAGRQTGGSRAGGRPLKIALLTHSVNPRGGVVHTLELAQALHDVGHAVTVLAPALPGQAMFRAVRCRLRLVPVAESSRSTADGAGASAADAGASAAPVGSRDLSATGCAADTGTQTLDAAAGSAGTGAQPLDAADGAADAGAHRSRATAGAADRAGDRVATMVASRIAGYERYLAALLADESFDVLHAQDPIGANALANLQDRGLIAGFVRTVHHLDPFDHPQLDAWQRRGFERAAQVLCVSRLWRDVLREQHGIDAAVVHNGVDCARYTRRRDASDARVAAFLNLRADGSTRHAAAAAPLVLAVGGVEQRKNSCRLLDAFAVLHAERPGARLVIAGGASLLDHDAYGAAFRARVQAAGLSIGVGRPVVLTGGVPDADMPALYRAADVLAMPSLREGFGLAVLEALASGTPVVASRIAPFTEYLNQDGADDCVWADPTDSASIAAALRRALSPARAAAMAAGGVPAVCRRFGWPASAARHAALYRAGGAAPEGRPRRAAAAAAAPAIAATAAPVAAVGS